LSGYYPFSAEYQPLTLNEQIMRGAYSFPARYWHGVSPDAIDLIRKMLTVDPEKRITADNILCHRWLQVKETVIKTCIHFLSICVPNSDSSVKILGLVKLGKGYVFRLLFPFSV
jgi:serine/threonine protein kinase